MKLINKSITSIGSILMMFYFALLLSALFFDLHCMNICISLIKINDIDKHVDKLILTCDKDFNIND